MVQHAPDEAWRLFCGPKPEETVPAQKIATTFARTFSTPEGERVLAHLLTMTRERTLGPETPDTILRYVEGQRGLVAYMERLIARGRG